MLSFFCFIISTINWNGFETANAELLRQFGFQPRVNIRAIGKHLLTVVFILEFYFSNPYENAKI
jgi:hypothetical protein